jgi:AraC family transcriptional activator of mtrCDE
MHYVLLGTGKSSVENGPTIDLIPHTLVVLPPRSKFTLHARHADSSPATNRIVESTRETFPSGVIRRLVAGSGEPDLIVVCGYFRENFTAADQLDQVLKSALSELIAQEPAQAPCRPHF